MKKINILIGNEAKRLGRYYGFWNLFEVFKDDLFEYEIEVSFFNKLNKKFLEGDYLFLNSRLIPTQDQFINLNYLNEVKKQNENLFWFDMRDSAGTTQFEVLPFVKKYIKKNYYKNKNIYLNELRGGRFYTDYYIKKYNIQDKLEYNIKTLENKFLSKLVLGWNLGVGLFFDYTNYSKIDYYKELIEFNFFKKKNFSMKLKNYQNWENDKSKFDFICLMNKNFERSSVGFQRKKLCEKISKISNFNKVADIRLNKKKYYETLRNSKVSVGSFGWGEVCYREFEAIACGAAIMFPDMSLIETWPNIYIDNETYLSYDLDFKNFDQKLSHLISDVNLRKKLVNNSQDIMNDVHNYKGKEYFIKKIFEIIS